MAFTVSKKSRLQRLRRDVDYAIRSAAKSIIDLRAREVTLAKEIGDGVHAAVLKYETAVETYKILCTSMKLKTIQVDPNLGGSNGV